MRLLPDRSRLSIKTNNRTTNEKRSTPRLRTPSRYSAPRPDQQRVQQDPHPEEHLGGSLPVPHRIQQGRALVLHPSSRRPERPTGEIHVSLWQGDVGQRRGDQEASGSGPQQADRVRQSRTRRAEQETNRSERQARGVLQSHGRSSVHPQLGE